MTLNTVQSVSERATNAFRRVSLIIVIAFASPQGTWKYEATRLVVNSHDAEFFYRRLYHLTSLTSCNKIRKQSEKDSFK